MLVPELKEKVGLRPTHKLPKICTVPVQDNWIVSSPFRTLLVFQAVCLPNATDPPIIDTLYSIIYATSASLPWHCSQGLLNPTSALSTSRDLRAQESET